MKRIFFLTLFIPVSMSAHGAPVDMVTQALSSWQNTIDQFGKTHFIIGFPHQDFAQAQKTARTTTKTTQATPRTTAGERTAFFSPDDDLTQILVDLIGKEQRSIKVAIFMFTDKDIAQALLDAHKRGVRVEVVADPSYKADRYSKVTVLKEAGIPIYDYNPNYISDMRSNIMHHKFIVFGAPSDDKARVWTGSFNFTRAARDRNQENGVILVDRTTVTSFDEQFNRMKQQRCVHCNKHSVRVACGSSKKRRDRA
jgi:phosphatidylserine/phosphatidylglycerophosphate/cardiolipin synthase-like enzyme